MLYKVDPGLSSDADMYIKSICTGNTVGHIEHIGQKYYVLAAKKLKRKRERGIDRERQKQKET